MNRRGFLRALLVTAACAVVPAPLLAPPIKRKLDPTVWSVNQLGGFMYSDELRDVIRQQQTRLRNGYIGHIEGFNWFSYPGDAA